MSLTDCQAKCFAHELTRRFPPDSVEKITVAFAGAQVDLNPHQIDEAHRLRNVYKPSNFIEAEADKLDGWADDLKIGLVREIKELDRQIKEARRAATTALTLEEKLAGQK